MTVFTAVASFLSASMFLVRSRALPSERCDRSVPPSAEKGVRPTAGERKGGGRRLRKKQITSICDACIAVGKHPLDAILLERGGHAVFLD